MAFFILGLVGCGDSGTDPVDEAESEYQLQVTGGLQFEADGRAAHSGEQATNPGFIQVVNFLPDGDRVRAFRLLRRSSSSGFNAGNGTLGEIGSDWVPDDPAAVVNQWVIVATLENESGDPIQFYSEGGSINLSGSMESIVTGQFDATLAGVQTMDGAQEEITVQVTMEFTSLPPFLLP